MMKGLDVFASRSPQQVFKAIFGAQHYRALIQMQKVYPHFRHYLWRYLTGRGNYPHKIALNTPLGTQAPTLYSHHDMLTVNEIFCRQDYELGVTPKVVVDIGANIGLSALYFLTRDPQTRLYLYEPDPRNIKKLHLNLSQFENRYTLFQKAVAPQGGLVSFGQEATGRYGGIGLDLEDSIQIEALGINELLASVLEKHPHIDLLKMDIEGLEVETLLAIHPEWLSRINAIAIEAEPTDILFPEIFEQKQYGSVCRFMRKF